MNKINRKIDESKMNASKERTMDYVLSSIKPVPKQQSFFTRSRMVLVTTFVVIIALVVMLVLPDQNTPGPNPGTISAYESERIAEVTYITTSLIGSNVFLNTGNMALLSNNILLDEEDPTEFENNEELINLYFDTFRVFLEDDLFKDSITKEISEEEPNTHIISFTIQNIEYVLTVTFVDDEFTGTLLVGAITYSVTGKLEETTDQLKLELEATNGNDYVNIKFESEQDEEETERQYQIKERINNVVKEQEIKVSREQNEYKVEVKDGDDEFQLKKELEGSQYQYKLEYKVNGVEGEAVITETIDGNGLITYQYQIKEGTKEKEVQSGRPNYDHEDDEDDEEEDDEDENGNGYGNQYYDEMSKTEKIFSV